jgi:ketopantoate reductase
MKIAVIGAGAIGGLVGARLALSGASVTFIVRGANLEAIRHSGFTLVYDRGRASRWCAMCAPPTTTARPGRRTSSSWR